VDVIMAMRADFVPFGRDAPDEVLSASNVATQQEERGFGIVLAKHV
jgi:hypothetical protein